MASICGDFFAVLSVETSQRKRHIPWCLSTRFCHLHRERGYRCQIQLDIERTFGVFFDLISTRSVSLSSASSSIPVSFCSVFDRICHRSSEHVFKGRTTRLTFLTSSGFNAIRSGGSLSSICATSDSRRPFRVWKGSATNES